MSRQCPAALRPRDACAVRLGSKDGHPAVVLRVDGDFAYVIGGTLHDYSSPERVTVYPDTFEGAKLGLSCITYFFRSAVVRVPLSKLGPWAGTCTLRLFQRLNDFAGPIQQHKTDAVPEDPPAEQVIPPLRAAE